MKLTELVAKLDGCRLLETAPAQVDIESVDIDSRECRKGSLFACVKGYVLDGHDFAGKALERGAAALLTESPALLKEKAAAWEKGYVQGDSILWQGRLIPVIVTDNIRRDVARIADILADHPSGKLELIGITGTKGKTTTSYISMNVRWNG